MWSGLSRSARQESRTYICRSKHSATEELTPSLRMLMGSAYEQEGDRNVLLQFHKW